MRELTSCTIQSYCPVPFSQVQAATHLTVTCTHKTVIDFGVVHQSMSDQCYKILQVYYCHIPLTQCNCKNNTKTQPSAYKIICLSIRTYIISILATRVIDHVDVEIFYTVHCLIYLLTAIQRYELCISMCNLSHISN